MERPIFKSIGTPVEELDTPALVVDLSVLEQNIQRVHSFFQQMESKVRPHMGSHRSPAIAHKQLQVEGTVGGVCVTSVGQAEVFAQNGIDDIFVTNEIVTSQKIGQLCALTHSASITVAVDYAPNVKDLSEAAQSSGVTLGVVVDVNTSPDRSGVEPGQRAVDLAKVIETSANLHFKGLMTLQGGTQSDDLDEMETESRRSVQAVLDTREIIEKAGMEVEVLSAGGTHDYELVGKMSGVTEVPAGAYALMDCKHLRYREELSAAAKVLTTVTSLPEPGIVILDAGGKSVGSDGEGLPIVEGIRGATAEGLSAEHVNLSLDTGTNPDQILELGLKVLLTPWDISTCVNLYDYIRAVRNDKLESMWDIPARGRYR